MRKIVVLYLLKRLWLSLVALGHVIRSACRACIWKCNVCGVDPAAAVRDNDDDTERGALGTERPSEAEGFVVSHDAMHDSRTVGAVLISSGKVGCPCG